MGQRQCGVSHVPRLTCQVQFVTLFNAFVLVGGLTGAIIGGSLGEAGGRFINKRKVRFASSAGADLGLMIGFGIGVILAKLFIYVVKPA
jgi:hypothetical protein